VGRRRWEVQPGFFLLGAGFMLLKLQIRQPQWALLDLGRRGWGEFDCGLGLLCFGSWRANLVYQGLAGDSVVVCLRWMMFTLLVMFIVADGTACSRILDQRGLSWRTLVLCSPVFFAGIGLCVEFCESEFKGVALGRIFLVVGGRITRVAVDCGLDEGADVWRR